MRARVLFGVASLVAVAGMLWGSVTPASACRCAYEPIPQRVALSSVVLIGQTTNVVFDPPLSEPGPFEDRRTTVELAVERYLKGTGPMTLQLHDAGYTVVTSKEGRPVSASSNDCSLGLTTTGRRYLLFFAESPVPTTAPSKCSGSYDLGDAFAPGESGILEVESALTGGLPQGGGLPSRTEVHNEHRTLTTVALLALGTLAVLSGAAFLWRRGESHNG